MARWVIGIDEVGRGALAGPVVVAAALVKAHWKGTTKDSKRMTALRREAWCAEFSGAPDVHYAVARVYQRSIERVNIARAANLAASRAYEKLMKKVPAVASGAKVLLDGGLYIKNRAWQTAHVRKAETRIRADQTVPAVMAASIFAKVHRDRFMVKLAKRHPGYGFDIHKGYGTAAHRAAIARFGPATVHRLTFLS